MLCVVFLWHFVLTSVCVVVMMQAVDHPYLVVHSASAPGAAEAQKKLQDEEVQGLLQGTPTCTFLA